MDDDRAAEIAAIAERLDGIPTPGPVKGRRVPIHPKQQTLFAEELHAKGFRVHPELATLFPIPGKRRGAMPYTNLPDWVGVEDYATYLAENPGAAPAIVAQPRPNLDQLHAALAAVDPALAARLPAMTDAEREATRAQLAAKIPAALQRLADIADRNHRLAQGALRNARGGDTS